MDHVIKACRALVAAVEVTGLRAHVTVGSGDDLTFAYVLPTEDGWAGSASSARDEDEWHGTIAHPTPISAAVALLERGEEVMG